MANNLPSDQYGPPGKIGPNEPDAPHIQLSGATGASFSPEHTGAIVLPIHITRQMKVYPIQEHELTMLQSLSSDKTFWSSVGSGAIALLLSCAWDCSQLADKQKVPTDSRWFMGALIVIALFSFGRAYWRKTTIEERLKTILSQSNRE